MQDSWPKLIALIFYTAAAFSPVQPFKSASATKSTSSLDMSSIKTVHAREILDSRGNPTVEVSSHSSNVLSLVLEPSMNLLRFLDQATMATWLRASISNLIFSIAILGRSDHGRWYVPCFSPFGSIHWCL